MRIQDYEYNRFNPTLSQQRRFRPFSIHARQRPPRRHRYRSYPPYNIEATSDNHYTITIAVAGFTDNELDIQVERGVLTVRGKKAADEKDRNYLYQALPRRSFERKFNLAVAR